MVYKVDKKLVVLTVVLLLSSLFFTYSVYAIGMGGGGLAVCFVAVLFILFNLMILLSKKIEMHDGEISQVTLYGKKSVKVEDIEDIGIVKLRWRIILILSDPHKFVFISSLYDDFEGFVQELKNGLSEKMETLLAPVTPKMISAKKNFLLGVVVIMTVFFIGSGFYNILYR